MTDSIQSELVKTLRDLADNVLTQCAVVLRNAPEDSDGDRQRLAVGLLCDQARVASRMVAAYKFNEASTLYRITEIGISAGFDIRHGDNIGGLTVLGLVEEMANKLAKCEK